MESQSTTSSEPSPSTSVSPKEESPREEKREAVKEQKKVKKPLTEKRIAQLAAARAARKKKADERRAQKESSRLVKDDGESANRYLEVLKSNSPDIEISKSESKKKKRKFFDDGGEKEEREMNLGSAAKLGLGLLGAAAVSYVAGKNLTKTATESGFSGPGSAIPQSAGEPAIPIQEIVPEGVLPRFVNGRPSVPSVGYF